MRRSVGLIQPLSTFAKEQGQFATVPSRDGALVGDASARQHPRMSQEPGAELLGAPPRRLRRDVSPFRLGVPWSGDRDDHPAQLVLSRSRMTRVIGAIGVAAVIVASAAAAAIVLAFHNPARTGVAALGTPRKVQIVRLPGSLALPQLNKTVTAPQLVARLAADVESLPLQPIPWHCPNDFGTSYRLTFVAPGGSWTAVYGVQGCESVQIGSGRLQTAANSQRFWNDLGSALGLTALEVRPTLCVGTAEPGTVIEGRLCGAPS